MTKPALPESAPFCDNSRQFGLGSAIIDFHIAVGDGGHWSA